MSSDFYIPISIVLSHPGQFELKYDSNGDIDDARAELKEEFVDYSVISMWLQPVVLCKFGARESWRVVSIMDNYGFQHVDGSLLKLEYECCLHISCGGNFRTWLLDWLTKQDYEFDYME